MRCQGRIVNWNDEKGYGFVEPQNGENRAFVHIKAFAKSGRRPVDGDSIEYDALQERDGRYKAARIQFSRGKKNESKKSGRIGQNFGTVFTIGFCVFLIVAAVFDILLIELLALYGLASLFTFIIYAMDKSAAKKNKWRTKESTLHVLALIGGWPGAFFAQKKLRHKSSKLEFQFVYWVTVVVNIAGVLYFFTEIGVRLSTFIAGV